MTRRLVHAEEGEGEHWIHFGVWVGGLTRLDCLSFLWGIERKIVCDYVMLQLSFSFLF